MKISVVIPAYNEEKFLPACLESLARQTRRADEIIVVDNNSTDATAEVARRHGATVITEPQQGIMPAAWAGFMAAGCDIIARCDADSVLPVNWLSTIEYGLTNDSQAAGITGPATFYGTGPIAARVAQIWYMYAYFLLVGLALAIWPLFGSNCALRRSTWLAIATKVHSGRADIHDDMDISIHLQPDERIIFRPLMKVHISARPLRLSGLPSRYAKGFRTLFIHWPHDAPWQRWRRRLMSGSRDSASSQQR